MNSKFKDSAKIRLSERRENLFSLPSVRILSKPKAIKLALIAEAQPILFKIE